MTTTVTQPQRIKVDPGVYIGEDKRWEWKKQYICHPVPLPKQDIGKASDPIYLRHRWLPFVAKVHRKAFRSEPLNSRAVNDYREEWGWGGKSGRELEIHPPPPPWAPTSRLLPWTFSSDSAASPRASTAPGPQARD